jgi:hypothetical protein
MTQNTRFTFVLLLQEAERLEPAEDPTGYTYIDYSEKRSLPISVPDYHYSEKAGERYVVILNECILLHVNELRLNTLIRQHNQFYY